MQFLVLIVVPCICLSIIISSCDQIVSRERKYENVDAQLQYRNQKLHRAIDVDAQLQYRNQKLHRAIDVDAQLQYRNQKLHRLLYAVSGFCTVVVHPHRLLYAVSGFCIVVVHPHRLLYAVSRTNRGTMHLPFNNNLLMWSDSFTREEIWDCKIKYLILRLWCSQRFQHTHPLHSNVCYITSTVTHQL
jgi:hypothetical protein